jgi:hypothetical protein
MQKNSVTELLRGISKNPLVSRSTQTQALDLADDIEVASILGDLSTIRDIRGTIHEWSTGR